MNDDTMKPAEEGTEATPAAPAEPMTEEGATE